MRDTDADEKKKYVLKEICETERSFVVALKLICEEFYQAVHDHLSLEDSELLFAIARVSDPLICGCAVGEGDEVGGGMRWVEGWGRGMRWVEGWGMRWVGGGE